MTKESCETFKFHVPTNEWKEIGTSTTDTIINQSKLMENYMIRKKSTMMLDPKESKLDVNQFPRPMMA